jgi:hypothetical protein
MSVLEIDTPATAVPFSKPKRARVSLKKRKRAQDLEQRLRFLQDEFSEPELREILETAITATHRLATSTRSTDRDQVLFAIERQACHTKEEIMEETGISEWGVRVILKELETLELVDVRPQHDPCSDGSAPVLLYMMRHVPAGNAFFLSRPSPEAE